MVIICQGEQLCIHWSWKSDSSALCEAGWGSFFYWPLFRGWGIYCLIIMVTMMKTMDLLSFKLWININSSLTKKTTKGADAVGFNGNLFGYCSEIRHLWQVILIEVTKISLQCPKRLFNILTEYYSDTRRTVLNWTFWLRRRRKTWIWGCFALPRSIMIKVQIQSLWKNLLGKIVLWKKIFWL